MTKTFERFLRSFSDEDLDAFARDRREKRPPYWRVMEVALRIELSRRGLALDEDVSGTPSKQGSTITRSGVTA
jgi:hypothetical protein